VGTADQAKLLLEAGHSRPLEDDLSVSAASISRI
jgi:hypothetical protein